MSDDRKSHPHPQHDEDTELKPGDAGYDGPHPPPPPPTGGDDPPKP